MAGCGTAKENFAQFQNFEIGQSRDADRWHRYLKDSRTLPNGNMENRYEYGRCVFFREFDRATGRLIAWRIEGDDQDCRIVP